MCRVNSDSISFSLPPLNPRLVCDFSFEYTIDNRIVINTSSTTVIPFILNDVPFSLNGNEIDVTDQIKMGQNRLIFNTMNERQVITANVQWEKAKNVEAVVYKIMSKFPPMEIVPTSEFVNEIDPISKNQISFPGRGSTCTHAQCFDLKAFLNRAFETSHWECPLCGTYLTENDLRYDPCFFRNCGTSFLADDLYDTNVNDFF
ncbi:MIZ zinc finger family protein [Trichomonas vaginalis G3]|uniref:MIZ zinc finger family protein n=1 Tax=Trichomonas vaginalis (strain ATCC PRA-98 / G3) TaxID=412133 RepID=A2FS99_TRIV3|nr:SUMO transferase protein [Trichomonas vaginalis G3]EAX92215.1 MIZ zinc finger family protein [Trichomonas vaginalis G3]KAI5551181.1 SUMO transferase protein [Trichomonas vaginalis G3]|eukprot:XP_001305145.1 MIZ zinc finger family protein [Trichomonas vaginalis G3]